MSNSDCIHHNFSLLTIKNYNQLLSFFFSTTYYIIKKFSVAENLCPVPQNEKKLLYPQLPLSQLIHSVVNNFFLQNVQQLSKTQVIVVERVERPTLTDRSFVSATFSGGIQPRKGDESIGAGCTVVKNTRLQSDQID